MSVVDIFYQGEHGREIEVSAAALAETLAALKSRLAERHGYTAEVLVFVEDEDEPLSDEITIAVIVERGGKLHFHHCREVEVTVGFAGKRHSRQFAPSTTVARVKAWAAEVFNMTAQALTRATVVDGANLRLWRLPAKPTVTSTSRQWWKCSFPPRSTITAMVISSDSGSSSSSTKTRISAV